MIARTSPVDVVIGAIVTALKNSTGITALTGTRVYNNVPQPTVYPYIEVTSPTDRPQDTCGQFGTSILVDVKAVSQHFGDQEAAQILSHGRRALHFTSSLSVSGFQVFGVNWENGERYRETINGVVTRHQVDTYRVWVGQSA